MPAGAVCLVLLIALAGIQETVDAVSEGQTRLTTAVGELKSSVTIGQTFVASYDDLLAVQVSLGSYGRENSGEVLFHLCDQQVDSECLVAIPFDASEITGDMPYRFEFEPISDSAGRSFYFFLEAPAADSGNALGVLGAREDFFLDGQAVIEGLEPGQLSDLAFELEYAPSLLAKIDIFLGRIAAAKPSLFGDRRLYVALAVVYLALLYVSVFYLFGTPPLDEPTGQ
jgi:hypothetical protein